MSASATRRHGSIFRATLDQGRPVYGPSVTSAVAAPILDGIGLSAADLMPGLEPAVVSTGLRYLVIPVSAPALARAAITAANFASRRSPCTRAVLPAGRARSRSNLAVRLAT